ncbi:MAG: formate dehydrogenase accessory protein FdhE [Proteobacteria bacterium]|nr:formate dehydrogenase accessory protein FdhE [Pseudomonadota bacterium]
MTHPPTTRLRTPEEIALNAGADWPRLRLPDPDVFAERALRLRQLAAGHALRDYLLLLAVVAEAQHARLATYPGVPLPTPAQADAAAHAGAPLLATTTWPRDAAWRSQLRGLLGEVLANLPADSPARAGVQAVQALPDADLEQQADRLLAGRTQGLDLAGAPLIAAGLQLHWTHLVRASAGALTQPFGMPDDATRCPCCGSPPAASIVRIGGAVDGHRYLHCTLCSAQWHLVRVKCAHCLGTSGIQYQALQAVDAKASPQRAPVQAETCDTCGHYLKILHMTADPQVEPLADDLATLTLDLLVGEAGYAPAGHNLLLLFGEEDAAP